MKDDETVTTSVAASAIQEPFSIEKLQKVKEDFRAQQSKSFRDLMLTGIEVRVDWTGCLVPANGYCILMGKDLYDELKLGDKK